MELVCIDGSSVPLTSFMVLVPVQVLRVMAMTGAGLEEEGALEAGVAAMSSILGMEGLPREQAAVANLMTGMVKAMGSIACLSEVCCVVNTPVQFRPLAVDRILGTKSFQTVSILSLKDFSTSPSTVVIVYLNG